MTAATDPATALAYGAGRYAAGADGKTLLTGWRDGRALFALAAGLGDERHRERFAVLARYLLRRDRADGYWLLLPAELEGSEALVAELAGSAGRQVQGAVVQRGPGGGFAGLDAMQPLSAEPPLGDLLDGGDTLPAIMRRELDRLAEALGQPLPQGLPGGLVSDPGTG